MLDGEVRIVTNDSSCITVFLIDGLPDDRIWQFGSEPWDPGYLDDFNWLSVMGRRLMARAPDGSFWICKTQANQISRLPSDLTEVPWAIIGELTNGATPFPGEETIPIPTEFCGLQDITVAPDGAVWFTER
jgi:streptogramin lyase